MNYENYYWHISDILLCLSDLIFYLSKTQILWRHLRDLYEADYDASSNYGA